DCETAKETIRNFENFILLIKNLSANIPKQTKATNHVEIIPPSLSFFSPEQQKNSPPNVPSNTMSNALFDPTSNKKRKKRKKPPKELESELSPAKKMRTDSLHPLNNCNNVPNVPLPNPPQVFVNPIPEASTCSLPTTTNKHQAPSEPTP